MLETVALQQEYSLVHPGFGSTATYRQGHSPDDIVFRQLRLVRLKTGLSEI